MRLIESQRNRYAFFPLIMLQTNVDLSRLIEIQLSLSVIYQST